MSDPKLDRRRTNARRAATRLRAFLAEEVRTDRDVAGIIQAFEFTFEATWKLLQAFAAGDGLPAASPRLAIAAGYRLGLCRDEPAWLAMLADRNLTSHAHDAEAAREIFTRIRDQHAAALDVTLAALEAR